MLKPKLFFCLLIVILSSCSNVDPILEEAWDNSLELETSKYRSLEDALEIAQNNPFIQTSTRTKNSIDRSAVHIIVKNNSRSLDADTLMYVVNYENNNGFSIISADKGLPDILAITEKGHYNPETKMKNIPFQEYISSLEKSLSDYSTNKVYGLTKPDPLPGQEPFVRYRTEESSKTLVNIGPKVKVNWGQEGCEGKYAPNKIAGCTNIACAMIMSYFQHPTQITLTFPDRPVSSTILPWSEMSKHSGLDKSFGTCNDDATASAHEAISLLVRELGYRNNSDYSNPESTSTGVNAIIKTMNELGYNTPSFASFNEKSLLSLSDGIISLIAYREIAENGETKRIGHNWLIDGHKRIEKTVVVYKIEWLPGWLEEKESYLTTERTITDYVHHNWGWDGDCNGYFFYGTYNPQNGIEYDNPNAYNRINREYYYSHLYSTISKK
ncbi:MAG: Spi family protease inhibitor [Muribaculaceae bacterium]|nr:Spi family protease inhibitor [Muribaculaceae bacterium]